MPYKNVHRITDGIVTAIAPTDLSEAKPGATPYCKGVYLKDGEVVSDYGHTAFPTAGATKTNQLHGSFMKSHQFYKFDGTSSLIGLTTTNAYQYNTSTTTWDCITRGETIDDCETAWSNSASVLKTVTASGNAQLDTAQKVFGTASLLLDGTGDYVESADHADWDFSGDFTVDFRVRFASNAGSQTVFDRGTKNTIALVQAFGSSQLILYGNAGTTIMAASWAPSINTWYHVAVSRTGSDLRIFIDGAVANTASYATAFTGTETFRIGALSDNTNALNGWIDEFRVSQGIGRWTAGFTLPSSAYTADAYTVLLLHFDGADASTTITDSSTDVTSGTSTSIKLRGSKSISFDINSFPTGIVAYRDFSSDNFTTNTALHFWVYSTTALTASDYSIRLSEQQGGGTGATYVDFAFPTISASTWTPCCVVGDFSSLDAVLSVSLVANVGDITTDLYIDDIRCVTKFTGDEDNQFSVAVMNDTFVCTNGIDQPQKYGGVLATGFESLTTTLNTGSISTSEVVIAFKDHLLLMNNTENGGDAPQRVSWTNIGSIEDWVNGTAGYLDLTGDSDWIITAKQLGENQVVIYKERSIVVMNWVGGQTPFRFTVMYMSDGASGKDAVENAQGDHIVIGNRYLYVYDGGTDIFQIDDLFGNTLYSSMNYAYINRSFVVYDKPNDELQIWVPTSSSYPDDIWTMNTVTKAWYRKDRTMTGFGYYIQQSTITIGDLVGTIGDQNLRIGDYLSKGNSPLVLVGDNNGKVYKLDTLTLNNDGTAITNEFQTPDFINPSQDDLDSFFRVKQLIFEAKGDSVTTEWSSDGGVTWNPTSSPGTNTTTLGATYNVYQQDFDTTTKKIRFRFRNITASSGYFLRHYGFHWLKRSPRK